MSPDYTLHTKLSSNGIFETWRGIDKSGAPAIIRIDVNGDGRGLIYDGDLCQRIRDKVKLKKAVFGKYFPADISWDEDGKPGYVIHEIPAAALSLAEVSKAFDHDIPLADAAWMVNRLLESLHLVHSTDHIHANITPDTFFIVPDTHEGKLIGFENAIAYVVGGVTAYNTWYKNPQWPAFYPEEYIAQENGITPSMDVYMASMVIGFLLPALPEDTPEALSRLLSACQLSSAKRIQTIQELHDDFNKIIKAEFGPRKFRPLLVP